MKCNVGKFDKMIRVFIGLTMMLCGVYFNSWLGAIGIIPIVTASLGWCPAYVPFGISSCSKSA